MFDLPTLTSEDRKEYRNFRKYLITSGFLMLQESVYSKLVLNTTSATIIMEHVRKHKPPSGSLFMLTVTEKQFSKMEIVVGDRQNEVIDSTERVLMI
ncbi:CRISPR-associated endonuclease Cas2 [Veillonella rodentium]|uniref:CRISPR-associated endoribonuclease Cas2 n=1 Tax=Veillonella rodentium TaxID=248315 RepID=A0A239Y062_9FIRM|nr:CRISPR-associated endonuclease Cas2 [Veillonella rodentium]SNV52277.1 CRISPR-associated endoribonuclease Cas2 [Veillonella rodentium]